MRTLKEQIALDISHFLNVNEFADEHDLNGTTCICVIQSVKAQDDYSESVYNAELVKDYLQVDCRESDLPEVPTFGQAFTVDGELYLVASVAQNMGMVTIKLEANDRG